MAPPAASIARYRDAEASPLSAELTTAAGVGEALRLREALRVAAEFQRAVLPTFPPIDYLTLELCYLPREGVSGDVYDFILNREGEVSVFLGDATGHGVVAALMTMMIHLGLDSLRPDLPTHEVLSRLNTLLTARHTGRSISAVYFRVTPDGRLSVSHAGHPSLLVMPADGRGPEPFHDGGCALGMFDEGDAVPYRQESRQLSSGDKLLVYTDGIIDWANPNGERFGSGRLLQTLAEHYRADARGQLDALLERVESFARGATPPDDATVLCLEYRKPG